LVINKCVTAVKVSIFSGHLLYKNLKIKTYRSIILPVSLNGCETWLLTLREKHRLIVFENRVWRRVFGGNRRVEKTAK